MKQVEIQFSKGRVFDANFPTLWKTEISGKLRRLETCYVQQTVELASFPRVF